MELEFPELQEFGTELAVDLWREGLYVAARQPKPPGTRVHFTLRLGRRSTQISGRGEVAWVRSRDEGPKRPAGMEIRFLDLDDTSVGAQNVRIFKLVNADATAMAEILADLFNLRQGSDMIGTTGVMQRLRVPLLPAGS